MGNRSKNRNALLGIIILAIGTFLLLDNFNLLDFPVKQYIFSWKTLLIVIGLALLASRKNSTGGIILVSLGTIFWIPEIFNHQIALNQIFLPAVLIVFGVIMLSRVKTLNGSNHHQVEEAEIIEMETEKSR
jgi:predicted membrane protein